MKTLMLTTGLVMSTLITSCQGPYDHMNGYGHMMNHPYGGITMWITTILLVAVLGFGAYFFFKKGGTFNNESALDILKKRYAKGDISKEEFEEMKKNL